MLRNVLLLCVFFFSIAAATASAVEQTPQVWTTSVVPGEFPSQQAALAAVQAEGGVYALAQRVEDYYPTGSSIVYSYGATPRDPIVGTWNNYAGGQCSGKSSEEELRQCMEDTTPGYPGCPATTTTKSQDWVLWNTFYDHRTATLEMAFFDHKVHLSVGGNDCYEAIWRNQAWRIRDVSCPEYMTWDYTDDACIKKGIAVLVSQFMPCGACDFQHNPVSVSTGNKFQSESDFSLPWIDFKRSYNSAVSVPGARLGSGWTHFLNSRINFSQSATSVLLPTGEILPFFNNEAVDGSGWRLGYENGYVLYKPDETLRFDNAGRLVQIQRLKGDSIAIQYNDLGRVASATHSSGRAIQLEYETVALGRLIAIASDGEDLVTYEYDSAGRLEYANYPDGTSRRYHYENPTFPGHLTGITDEASNRYATYGYNANGYATLSEHAGGAYHGTFDYNPDGSTTYVDANGRSQTFQFTGDGPYRKVTSSADGAGTSTTSYNPNWADFRRRPSQRTDKLGVTETYAYSDESSTEFGADIRRVTTNEAVGTGQARTSERLSDLATNRLWKSSRGVEEQIHVRNARGQVETTTQRDTVTNATRSTTMAYCEQTDVTAGTCPLVGLVTSVNGPRTDVADTVGYTYYPSDDASCAASPTTCPHRKGDLWKVTNALGQVTETLAFDGAGRVLSVKDANGVVTDLEYHPRGWLISRKVRGANNSVETDDAITQIQYWSTGLVKKVIQPDGAFTSYTYDAAHRLTDILDNAGNKIHYTLDNAGNRTQEDTKDPGNVLKRTLSRVYNQLGQLQTQADAQANPTDFAYDANGNTDTVTDALDRVTNNDYDPLNRLSRTLQDVGGINAETQFAYDAQDNLTQVTDPKGLNTTYTYNGLGDLTQLASPDTGTTVYTYDSAGNRATQTDARNQTSTYSYDVLNRLTGIAYATSALNVGYTYDTTQAACQSGETFSAGRLTQLADASGSTQYCYDRFGHLVRKVQTTNGLALTVRYAYTLAGQLSSVTYPDGAVATYTRDAQGRTTQVNVQRAGAATEVLLNQASYHPFGPVAGWTYGNGRQLLRPLNQNYQPTAIHDATSGGLSVGFAYDPVGNLTQLTPAVSTTPLVKFDYDTLSRLTAFKDGPTDVAIESYAYDATGNRQSFTNASGTQAYTYPSTSHRLSQVGATARSYDATGNTTAIGGTAREFVYDDTGRMTQVKQNAIVQRSYAYNGKGEQVRKYAGTANTYTLYDEAGHWLGDYDNTGTALQQAIWLDDLPVGLIANGNQLHYVEPDHLGTPRVVIEVARNVPVWTWDLKSEAFGNSVPAQDPDGDSNAFVFDMRFPGQRFDVAAGLSYNYFRDYDSSIGGYIESDPMGMAAGVATYSYTSARPTNLIDSYGMSGTCPVASSFNPGFWNDGGYIQGTNNCYSYAADRPENPASQLPRPFPYKPQPGEWSGKPFSSLDCRSIIKASIRDGMTRPNKDGTCPACFHKVYLVIAPETDYHWYRQDQGGTWSHKPGFTPATNRDASGNIITNPETADRNYPGVNYSKGCGYLCSANR